MSVPKQLASRTWSCSELAKGAKVCADMCGMDLRFDAGSMTREQLLSAIQDSSMVMYSWVSGHLQRKPCPIGGESAATGCEASTLGFGKT